MIYYWVIVLVIFSVPVIVYLLYLDVPTVKALVEMDWGTALP